MSLTAWGRGNVYLRGKTYWIRYPDGAGGQRFESAGRGTTEVEARRLLDRRLFEIERGEQPGKPKERKRTVDDLLDALELDYRVRRLRSARQLISTVKPLREALGTRRANNINKDDLVRYIVARREADYGDETIAAELRRLRQAYGLQDGIRTPKFPPIPAGRARDVLIAPAEQRRLIAAMDERYRDLTEAIFAMGWRGVELRTLRWKNVRRDSIRLTEEHSKTKEPRDYPLIGALAEIIGRCEAVRVPVCEFVFHVGGRPIPYTSWLRAFKRAAAEAGIAIARPHDARRAAVTEMVDSGVDQQTAMLISGHKTASMLQRYRIVKTETLARAVERREQYVNQRREAKVIPLRANK